jgi:plasmid stability protein
MDLYWFHNGTTAIGDPAMPVSLSIKNVPDDIASGLRARAARNHRSLQGELLAILEEAVSPSHLFSAKGVLARVRAMRLTTPDDATQIVRADRDAR